jgi:tetratricopeptide (TPR) repeat protein
MASAGTAQEIASILSDADRHFGKSEYREAEAEYKRVLDTDPRLQHALVGVAKCRIALGRPQEALAPLNQVLALNPDDREARRELGHAFATGNIFPRAEQILKTLVDNNPDDTESSYYLGCLMYQNGYYGAALMYLERSHDRKVADPVRQVKTEVYRAVCLSRMGRNHEAESAFRKLALQPGARAEPDMLLVYAELLYETGRTELALQRVDEALVGNGSLAMGYFWRARLLLHLNRLPEAAAAAERSINLIPQLPYSRNLLMRIYQALGRPADAALQADWLRQYEERLTQVPAANENPR